MPRSNDFMLSSALPRNFVLTLMVLFPLIGMGTLGYHILEDHDFSESLSSTVIPRRVGSELRKMREIFLLFQFLGGTIHPPNHFAF